MEQQYYSNMPPCGNGYPAPPRASFRIRFPRKLAQFIAGLFGFMIVILVFPMVMSLASGDDLAGWIFLMSLLAVSGGLVVLWAYTGYVQVNGWMITVRKTFGLVKFTVHISEIRKVTNVATNVYNTHFAPRLKAWRMERKVIGRNYNMTVHTDKGNFKVESLLENSNLMIRYLEENLHPACFVYRDLT